MDSTLDTQDQGWLADHDDSVPDPHPWHDKIPPVTIALWDQWAKDSIANGTRDRFGQPEESTSCTLACFFYDNVPGIGDIAPLQVHPNDLRDGHGTPIRDLTLEERYIVCENDRYRTDLRFQDVQEIVAKFSRVKVEVTEDIDSYVRGASLDPIYDSSYDSSYDGHPSLED